MDTQHGPENAILVELTRQSPPHETLHSIIDTVRARGVRHVIVEFSAVDSVGSPALSRLLELRRVLRESGHKLVLFGVPDAIRGILRIAQLEPLFDFAEAGATRPFDQ